MSSVHSTINSGVSATLLINVELPEIRVAELRGGRLFELSIDRGGRLMGDIFKGRVENVLPGMDAAFVDVGLKRNALIYAGDVGQVETPGEKPSAPIERKLKSGDEIVVQVARPPVGNKGARVTTRLSLPGRFVVLSALSDAVGVSRRLEDEAERARLRRLAEKLRPLDHGLIVRTEAEGVSESEMARDVSDLLRQLQTVRASASTGQAPRRLHQDMGILGRLVRDRLSSDIAKIVVDSAEIFQTLQNMVRQIAPHLLDRLEFYRGQNALFATYGVEKEIALACERSVPLKRGGVLVIDETEALTSIDVNTGKFVGKNRLADTVLQTNLEAVEEAARQIRLRDLAGVIVIDFIDMERTRDRIKVLNALEVALSQDRAKTRIVQLSPSGLVEMTRQREGQSLRQLLHRSCPYCGGDGVVQTPQTVGINVRRRVREQSGHGFNLDAPLLSDTSTDITAQKSANQDYKRGMQIVMHPESACAFLGDNDDAIRDLERETQTHLWLQVEFALHLEASRILGGASPQESQFANFARDFKIGEQFRIASHASLYPQRDPQFVVLQNLLVKIKNLEQARLDSEKAVLLQPLLLQITQISRWYLDAQIIESSAI